MNDRERAQLQLIAEHGIATSNRALEERINAILASHSAKGRLHSGATIIVSVKAMHAAADELLSDLVVKAKAIAADQDAFRLISATMKEFMDHCAAVRLPPVVEIAQGRSVSARNDSIDRAANEKLGEVRKDIAAKLAILAFDFGDAPEPSIAIPAQPPAAAEQPAKKGGRPPAEFWDDMWAAMAFALYNGDLAPKSQADVERAMADWIEHHGHSAVTSTVRARARRLWDRLAAIED
jgi:hypothetical protein